MADSAIRLLMTLLSDAPSIRAIVDDRIYAEVAPQAADPAATLTMPAHIVLRLVGGSQDSTLDGPSEIQEARIVIIAHSSLFAEADAAAAAALGAVQSFFQGQIDGTAVTMFRDGLDTSDFLSDRRLFRRACEVRLVFNG